MIMLMMRMEAKSTREGFEERIAMLNTQSDKRAPAHLEYSGILSPAQHVVGDGDHRVANCHLTASLGEQRPTCDRTRFDGRRKITKHG